MVLELEDLSQKAEKASDPQNTMKREMMVRKRLFTRPQQLRIHLRQRQHVLTLLINHVHKYGAAPTHPLKGQLHVFARWGASAEDARLQE